VLGGQGAAAIVGVGGDVPPELLDDPTLRFPPVLFTRGVRDEWMTQARFDKDVAAMNAKGVGVRTEVYDAAHEWTPEVAASIANFLRSLPPGYV
jgi:predicted esterase